MKSLTPEYIKEHSNVACNLWTFFKNCKGKSYGNWILEEEGHIILIEYLLGELLASILSPPQPLFTQYLGYYFYDLFPLSLFIKEILAMKDTRERILEKVEEYSKAIEKNV